MTLFVRKLTVEEKIELNNWSNGMEKDLRHRSKVILLSSQGYMLKEIARLTNHHYRNLSKWIKRFNENGIMGLVTQHSGGREPKITEDDKKIILDLAKSKPRDLGLPFTNWTLERLREEANKRCVDISHEWIRQILIGEGYSYKKTKEWIDSPDPEYHLKKKQLKI